MANLWLLLKIQILRLLTGKPNSKKASGVSRKKIGTGALLFIVLSGVSLSYAFMYAEIASLTGQYFFMFQAMLVMYLMFAVFFGIYDAVSSLFGYKDYDFLASLPIKKFTIVVSKLLYTFLLDLFIAIIIFIPTAIVYGLKVKVTATFYLNLAYNCLFIPFIPLAFTLLIGIGIKLIFSGIKRKSLFETVFSMALALGFILFFSFGEDNISIYTFVEKIPVINWFLKGLDNFGYSLAFSGVSLALGAGVSLIVALNYSRLHTLLTRQKTSGNYKVKTVKQKGLGYTLVKKEYSTLLGIPVYATNILFGPILGIALAIVLVVLLRVNIPIEELKLVAEVFAPYILPVLILIGGIATMSAPSVSLEGKNFGLLKTLPISSKKIILSKYLASFIVSASNIVLPAVIAVIGVAVPVWYALLIVVGSILGAVATNAIAMTLGIKFAKFDWTNPAYPVKQSAAMGLSMLANMLFAGVTALLAWLMFSKLTIAWAMYSVSVFVALVAVSSVLLLTNYGVKKFERL